MSTEVESDLASTNDGAVAGQALVAQELQRYRERAGLSRTELARRVGYSRTYISTSEKPGADLVSKAVVSRIDAELNAQGALIAVHAKAEAERQARRARADTERVAVSGRTSSFSDASSHGATHEMRFVTPAGGRNDMISEVMDRSEFLRLAAAAAGYVAVSHRILNSFPDPLQRGAKSWAARTHDAVLHPTEQARRWANSPGQGHAKPLRLLVDQLIMASFGSNYASLDSSFPELLGRAELEVIYQERGNQPQLILSDVYAVAGWLLIKANDPLGAEIAAQRAVRAAQAAEDGLRVAATMRCLAEVHMRNGNYEKAVRTALLATVGLDQLSMSMTPRAVLSLRGAALLSAAAASARHGERHEAYALLSAAARCADATGEDCYDLATVFGPTNVAIHRVAVAVELGDPKEALRQAEKLRINAISPMFAERRSRYLLDVARAHVEVGDIGTTVDTLMIAEELSSDEVHHHRITQQLVPRLLAHDRRHPHVIRLAQRCGLVE